jgi:lysophospholipase L1-like esterase
MSQQFGPFTIDPVSGAVSTSYPGSPSAPFADTAARNAAYAVTLPGFEQVAWSYVDGIPSPAKWFGPTGDIWIPQESSLFATKVAFLGTSITNGSTAGNSVYAFPQQTVNLCGGRIAIEDSIEAGVGGEQTYQMLARLPNLLSKGIGILVLECGTNDCGHDVTVSTWASQVTQIARLCNRSGVKMIQVMPLPQKVGSPASAHTLITGYRVWLAQSAKALGITIAHAPQLTDPTTGYLATTMGADDVHPTQLGHQWLAQAVAKTILEILGTTKADSVVVGKAPWLGGVVDPLMTGTTTPAGSYEQGGGSGTAFTYTCIADTSGDLLAGKWWQAECTALANTTRNMAMGSSTLAFAVGDSALLHCKIQVDDVSGNWMTNVLAGTAAAVPCLNSGGVNRHIPYYLCPGLYCGNGMYSYDVYLYVPAVAYTSFETWLQFTIPNGSHYRVRWGEVQIYNLTALGVNGATRVPTVAAMPAIP